MYRVVNPDKTQITVLCSFNAMGMYPSPMIVFPGQRIRDLGIADFPEAVYGVSETGWMNDLFLAYLQTINNFINAEKIPKPILLFVDGHSSH